MVTELYFAVNEIDDSTLGVVISVAVLVETSLTSPRQLFIFTNERSYFQDQSVEKQINLILKTNFTGPHTGRLDEWADDWWRAAGSA